MSNFNFETDIETFINNYKNNRNFFKDNEQAKN